MVAHPRGSDTQLAQPHRDNNNNNDNNNQTPYEGLNPILKEHSLLVIISAPSCKFFLSSTEPFIKSQSPLFSRLSLSPHGGGCFVSTYLDFLYRRRQREYVEDKRAAQHHLVVLEGQPTCRRGGLNKTGEEGVPRARQRGGGEQVTFHFRGEGMSISRFLK